MMRIVSNPVIAAPAARSSRIGAARTRPLDLEEFHVEPAGRTEATGDRAPQTVFAVMAYPRARMADSLTASRLYRAARPGADPFPAGSMLRIAV